VDLKTVNCRDAYHGPWKRARDFVCSSCQAQEAVILDEESWYLVGMVAMYQKQFQPFINEMKALFDNTVSLISFSSD
jgi:hypothetical protein